MLFDFVAWLEANRLKAIVYFGLFLVVLFGVYFYTYNKRMTEDEGLVALVNAQTNRLTATTNEVNGYSKALRAVQQKYPGTKAAERASLLWAVALFEEGKYEDALTEFDSFLKAHGKSPLAVQAQLGRATCLDETGKSEEVAKDYQQIIKDHAKRPEANLARMNLAALHQQSGKLADAKDLYDEAVKADSDFFQRQLPFAFGGSGLSRTARQLANQLEDAHPEIFSPKVKFPNLFENNATKPEGNATLPKESNATKPEGNATLPKESNGTSPKVQPKEGNATQKTSNATSVPPATPSSNATGKK